MLPLHGVIPFYLQDFAFFFSMNLESSPQPLQVSPESSSPSHIVHKHAECKLHPVILDLFLINSFSQSPSYCTKVDIFFSVGVQCSTDPLCPQLQNPRGQPRVSSDVLCQEIHMESFSPAAVKILYIWSCLGLSQGYCTGYFLFSLFKILFLPR